MYQETCPRCGSNQIALKQTARHSGAVIGLTAGAASGAAGAMYGARAGYSMGIVAGPSGASMGTIAGAILGALAGGTAGCLTGITVGRVVDDNLLGNRRCKRCRHVFTAPSELLDEPQRPYFDAQDLDPHDPDYPHVPYYGHPGGHQ
jgi:hypothetical protein